MTNDSHKPALNEATLHDICDHHLAKTEATPSCCRARRLGGHKHPEAIQIRRPKPVIAYLGNVPAHWIDFDTRVRRKRRFPQRMQQVKSTQTTNRNRKPLYIVTHCRRYTSLCYG